MSEVVINIFKKIMGLGCFSCGNSFNGDTNALLKHFKKNMNKKRN